MKGARTKSEMVCNGAVSRIRAEPLMSYFLVKAPHMTLLLADDTTPTNAANDPNQDGVTSEIVLQRQS